MEGAWFVPSFPRGGGREGRSDVWETEGAQSALARALETAVRVTALGIVSPAPLFNYQFYRPSQSPIFFLSCVPSDFHLPKFLEIICYWLITR